MTHEGSRVIHQGDVFWIEPEALAPSVPGQAHPHVVIQADVLNQSRITTVVVCGLTSNLKRLAEPGNVLLDAGEADLPRPSVVIVSQVSTVEKARLGAYVGTLSTQRVEQILGGMSLQQRSFFPG
ncbi:MAG: type II toxin-antitoxin system PemK/MazF family toxin [Kofleriaceae bacterium]